MSHLSRPTGAARLVGPWYPSVSERLLTRDFVFIPTTGSVDWVALGEEWKEEVARLLQNIATTYGVANNYEEGFSEILIQASASPGRTV